MRFFDDRRGLLTAICLGLVFSPLQSLLFVTFGGAITTTLVDSIVGLGLKPHVYWLMRSANAVIWFALFGILFGVPLGLGVKAHVIRYWLVFVLAVTGANVVLSLWSEIGLGAVLVTWGLPEYWLYLVAVLCFASATPWVQRQFAAGASAAP
jgi:uncharacterized membrane protein YeaQ/YmgE (transglycosylase-associated protein family)